MALLAYATHPLAKEDRMPPISPSLLSVISQDLARIPLDPADADAVAAALSGQLDGLEQLDQLDLMPVEPATVLMLPGEVLHGRA
jgi:hypothetical protein